MSGLVDRIDALLPQTQCGRCGYPTCRGYAQAIVAGEADIDRCAPGGLAGVAALAQLLGRAAQALDPAYGSERAPQVALIDEDLCIGCTKCIQACPVDAIVGAAKRMHTVIADECTGCELCVPACPVDCIAMIDSADAPLTRAAVLARAEHARERYHARQARVGATDAAAAATESADATTPAPDVPAPLSRSEVLAAIARGRARRQPGQPAPHGGAADEPH